MIYVIGASGFAREAADVVMALGDSPVFVIAPGEVIKGPVYAGCESIHEDQVKTSTPYVLGMGNPVIRRKVAEKMTEKGLKPTTLVHPTAVIGKENEIGEGTIVTAGVVITNRCNIGAHCILNLNTTIGHDCTIGNYAEFSPGCSINGFTFVGEGVNCGSGTVTIPEAKIGEWSVIGAGAVVKGEIPPRSLAVGVPAKVIKTL